MKRDLTITSAVENGVSPGVYTGTQTGAAIDSQGFEYAVVTVHAGTFTSTATLDVVVQSSTATGSGYAAVTGAAFAQISTSNDAAIYRGLVRLDGVSRYIRTVGTYGGSGNAVYAVSVQLLNAQRDELADDFAFTV